MAKRTASAVELKAQLEASLPDAESAVTESAISFISNGNEQELRDSVNNLLQIREAIAAMQKVIKKSGKSPAASAVEPVSKAAD
jgi:hypothetical protein